MLRFRPALFLIAGCTGAPLPGEKPPKPASTLPTLPPSVAKPTSTSLPKTIAVPTSVLASAPVSAKTSVAFLNLTKADSTIYVSFGADSTIQAADWKSFCLVSAPLNCTFPLAAGKEQILPSAGYPSPA